jgi:hypothetical protein
MGVSCIASFYMALVYDLTRCSCLTGAATGISHPSSDGVPTVVGPSDGFRTPCSHEAAVPSPTNDATLQFGGLALTTSTDSEALTDYM